MSFLRILLFAFAIGVGSFSLRAADQTPAPTPQLTPLSRTALTNALNSLLPTDKVWLLGEQLKQLVGDWVNQQGDAGLDLLYYLQEPAKLLSDEIKRIDREHAKEIAELRAEIQALKQAQGAARANRAAVPPPATKAASTNQAAPRPAPRSGGR